MNRLVHIVLIVICTTGVTYSQKLSKAEETRIKAQLKYYMQHPREYKQRMEDTRVTLDSNATYVNNTKEQINAIQAHELELRNTLNEYQAKLYTAQQEIENLKIKLYKSDMKRGLETGTMYKVQLGAYKSLDVKNFEKAKYIGVEDAGGANRLVISYFTDDASAHDFVAAMRKMGFRDAFVAKYVDGIRVNTKADKKGDPELQSIKNETHADD